METSKAFSRRSAISGDRLEFSFRRSDSVAARTPRISAARLPDRAEVMARAYASGAYSQAAIAAQFRVRYSTVSRAARRHDDADP